MRRIPSRAIVIAFVLVGVVRLGYGLTASPQGWTGATYIERVYRLHVDESVGVKRRWGPLFLLAMRAYDRVPLSEPARQVVLRAALAAFYVATIVLLAATMPRARRLLFVGFALQSTAAIYAISDGMGELVTAWCIAAHFVLFLDRRFWAAALVVWLGVYFKVHPIVFVFPYAIFALLSRESRRYLAASAACGLLVAAIAIVGGGWRYGFLYPLTLVRSVVSDADLIPILSKEVFGPMSVVARLASGFRVRGVDAAALALARRIAPVFTALLIGSTATAGVALARRERRGWTEEERCRAIAAFQAAIGFLMFAFSLDVSWGLLLPILVSVYAPFWFALSPGIVTLFLAGSVLAGNLLPLSLLLRVVPFGWFDAIAGNAPAALIPHEKYVWYELPMLGVLCVCAAFVMSWRAAVTRDSRSPRNPGS